jgi:hypothetical protein
VFESVEASLDAVALFIQGICTGRDFGIIDTVQLIEVAVSIEHLLRAGWLKGSSANRILRWFEQYLEWVLCHEFGRAARAKTKNHATGWICQMIAFSRLIGNNAALLEARRGFCEVLLPRQIARDGGFPFELKRTRPYNYTIFNLELMALIYQLDSTDEYDLWRVTTHHGVFLLKAFVFMDQFL